MVHLRDVDTVAVAMRTDPLDPDDPLLEVDGHHQPVTVPLMLNTIRSALTMLAVA